MQPVLRQITTTPAYSFLVRKDTGSDMVNNWHYHPEIELLFIKRSVGTWLVGDHIGHFKTGDVILVGANLPHCFRHEQDYIQQKGDNAGETICIKFTPEMLGAHFLSLPECKDIRQLFEKCKRGLKLKGKTKASVAKAIEKITDLQPGKKLVQFLSILEIIATAKDYTALASVGFAHADDERDKDRIKRIFEYTFNHYDEKITIDKLASLINMTRQSFCRYFKSKTNKTYVNFLMEVRVGHACRMLVEDEKNVGEICYACGYNTISHFNHQFKLITGKKPLEYKKDYLQNELK